MAVPLVHGRSPMDLFQAPDVVRRDRLDAPARQRRQQAALRGEFATRAETGASGQWRGLRFKRNCSERVSRQGGLALPWSSGVREREDAAHPTDLP